MCSGILTITLSIARNQRQDQSIKELGNDWTVRDLNVIRFRAELGLSKYALKRKQFANFFNNK